MSEKLPNPTSEEAKKPLLEQPFFLGLLAGFISAGVYIAPVWKPNPSFDPITVENPKAPWIQWNIQELLGTQLIATLQKADYDFGKDVEGKTYQERAEAVKQIIKKYNLEEHFANLDYDKLFISAKNVPVTSVSMNPIGIILSYYRYRAIVEADQDSDTIGVILALSILSHEHYHYTDQEEFWVDGKSQPLWFLLYKGIGGIRQQEEIEAVIHQINFTLQAAKDNGIYNIENNEDFLEFIRWLLEYIAYGHNVSLDDVFKAKSPTDIAKKGKQIAGEQGGEAEAQAEEEMRRKLRERFPGVNLEGRPQEE